MNPTLRSTTEKKFSGYGTKDRKYRTNMTDRAFMTVLSDNPSSSKTASEAATGSTVDLVTFAYLLCIMASSLRTDYESIDGQ